MSINEIKNEDKILSNKSKYILCPECKKACRIFIYNYKIDVLDNNIHDLNNIIINDFIKAQIIDETKIKCQNCKKVNKCETNNNIFFMCLNCKQNLCDICKENHDKTHNIIKNIIINYIIVKL